MRRAGVEIAEVHNLAESQRIYPGELSSTELIKSIQTNEGMLDANC